MSLQVRRGTVGDLDRLATFFRAAYGPRTVFQDARFVRWLFGAGDDSLTNVVAVDGDGAIQAHYGWLPCRLVGRGVDRPHIWGVNAYTLPSARGRGIGAALVDAVEGVCESFGVLGFPDDATRFYEQRRFNVFDGDVFSRHVLPLDPSVAELPAVIGTDELPAAALLRPPVRIEPSPPLELAQPSGWVDEPVAELAGYLTPLRSRRWLAWRYASACALPYTVAAHESDALGRALIAHRTIALRPTRHRVTKIVDLYGDLAAAEALVRHVVGEAALAGHTYVDHWSFGGPYAERLEAIGFLRLDGQDTSVLPPLTDPVATRPNTEHVCLRANRREDWAELTREQVYFAAANADRDRRASVPVTPG